MVSSLEKIPAGEARTALIVQMERMIRSTFIRPDLGDSGLTMACRKLTDQKKKKTAGVSALTSD